jgi:hypothetical protein
MMVSLILPIFFFVWQLTPAFWQRFSKSFSKASAFSLSDVSTASKKPSYGGMPTVAETSVIIGP